MRDKLYRSRKFRVLGGVCGGLAEYLNLDPVLVRVLFVIIALINGLGILLYIILWIVLPEESFEKAYGIKQDQTQNNLNKENSPTIDKFQNRGSGRIVFGVLLISIGLLFFVNNVFPYINFEDIFPLILIVIGIALIYNSFRNSRENKT
ncbi:PspC domain-containing protein [Melioribacteraceae bacterium 4301-Me]|uniref:PspC domain-containing protein n=1 Tax=Pyranulibacter aquaticus TaxID=3163344 RepID=UPI003597D17B